MDKGQLDEFYHNLRELCLTEDVFQKEAVAGIVYHLTQPQGDYTGLLRFLSYYGHEYVLPSVVKFLSPLSHMFKCSRVVELGAGFGWLGRGISSMYNLAPVVFVDKRQYTLIDVVADIETKNGMQRVLDELREGDFIIMSELLHCLDEPRETLQPFTRWPMLVIEYSPVRVDYGRSYNAQIEKFNCRLIGEIHSIFPKSKILSGSTDTHEIWLVLPS